MSVWYLSFVGDEGWLGGCFVQAEDAFGATQEAWRQGCNPGGEVAIIGPGPVDSIPGILMNRLLTREEVETMP